MNPMTARRTGCLGAGWELPLVIRLVGRDGRPHDHGLRPGAWLRLAVARFEAVVERDATPARLIYRNLRLGYVIGLL
jgi:hypothetical protein